MTAKKKRAVTQTLLIWETVPESTDLYLIEDPPEELDKCHGLYVNGTDMTEEQTEVMLKVSDRLAEKKDYCMNPDSPDATSWKDKKLNKEKIELIQGPVRIIQCGFLL